MKALVFASSLFLFFSLTFFGCKQKEIETEWIKLPAPVSAKIGSFAEGIDGTYYVGSSEMYKSKDQGNTWELMSFNEIPMEIAVTEAGTLLVGTYRAGIFRSIDQGNSWTPVGFENNVYIFKIIQTDEKKIFATATFISEGAPKDSPVGVFFSEDDGLSWKQTSISDEHIKGVFNPKPGVIIVSGTGENSFYRSLDNGQSWSSNSSGLPDTIPISGIVEFKGTLFASVGDPQDAARSIGGGIYKSEDDGLTWVQSHHGLSANTKVSDIILVENTLFVSTGYQINSGDRGVFKSDDIGQTWQATGLNETHLRLIRPTSSQQLIAGSNVSSIFISNNHGKTWFQTGKEIENWSIFQVVENNNYLFANGESGIWRATIPVKEWVQIRNETGSLVKTPKGTMLMAENGAILSSEDNGDHWSQIADLKSEMIFLYALDSKLLVACAPDDGMYFSSNDGHDWSKYAMGMFEQNSFRTAIKTPGGALLAGTARGTLRSDDQGKTWENVDERFFAWTYAKTDSIIYAGGYAEGIHQSTNDGLTWTEFNLGLREGNDYLTVTSLCTTSDNSVVCGTLGEGIYILKSNDSIWREHKIGLTDLVNFGTIEGNNGTIYTTSQKGIFKKN